jgi:hypothetical protein
MSSESDTYQGTVGGMLKTHKEEQRLWEEYEHDWPVNSVPRAPDFYQPVPAPGKSAGAISHFLESFKNLPGNRERKARIVRLCIQNGDVYPAEGENRYRFLWQEPMTRYLFSLIVQLRGIAFAKEECKHYAVTVYKVER